MLTNNFCEDDNPQVLSPLFARPKHTPVCLDEVGEVVRPRPTGFIYNFERLASLVNNAILTIRFTLVKDSTSY